MLETVLQEKDNVIYAETARGILQFRQRMQIMLSKKHWQFFYMELGKYLSGILEEF
jgi:hypothetical protein